MVDSAQTLTGAEAVVRSLELHGVELVFGIPGIHTLPIYDHLASSPIRHVSPRHEEGAGSQPMATLGPVVRATRTTSRTTCPIERVEPTALWLEGTIGPVPVSAAAAKLAQPDWSINVVLGRKSGKRHVLEVGNVYP